MLPSGLFGQPGDGVVDDAELRPKLALRAGGIDLAEAVLPESAAHRQQGIVVDDDGLSSMRSPIFVPWSWRETSPACVSSSSATSPKAAGCF